MRSAHHTNLISFPILNVLEVPSANVAPIVTALMTPVLVPEVAPMKVKAKNSDIYLIPIVYETYKSNFRPLHNILVHPLVFFWTRTDADHKGEGLLFWSGYAQCPCGIA